MTPQGPLVILSKLLQQLADWLQSKAMEQQKKTEADLIYETAFLYRGKDPTPLDQVSDELACVHSLSTIVRFALIPRKISFPVMKSTIELFEYLMRSPSWKEVTLPQYGDIVLSITGTGNGTIKHGHCGIYGKKQSDDGTNWIMSNDSRNGLWSPNHTLNSWNGYYNAKGGMYTHFYRMEHL